MNKKLLYPILIIATFFIGLLLNGLLTEIYNTNFPRGDEYELIKINITTNLITFLSSSMFYVIILISFREYKMIRLFSGTSLLISFCFSGYISLSNIYYYDSVIVRLYSFSTYFLALFNIYVASAITLKELHHKRVSITLIYTSVVTLFFGTLIIDNIRGYIAGVFGIEYNTYHTVFIIFTVVVIAFRASIVIAQAFAIVKLLEYKEHGKIMYKRQKLKSAD